MKILTALVILALSMFNFCFAQSIPPDSMYLGQTPPGSVPKQFNLSVMENFIPTERIAISNDGKTILYNELDNYPVNSIRIKYYRYYNNQWNGPFVLFEDFSSPGLSMNNDTLFMGGNNVIWYSVATDTGWATPDTLTTAYWHYLQQTNSGSLYASVANAQGNIGGRDWSEITINPGDTLITSLGAPINTSADEGDFYISGDESYMILSGKYANAGQYGVYDLYVSYRKENNSWTYPKNLGTSINLNDPTDGRWGVYVSPDGKYLFYSRGRSVADACTNWVRIDALLDSLKQTNFTPYVLNRIPDQAGSAGNQYSYAIPDTTFFDDDGNETLTLSASLNNGSNLPDSISFDPLTNTLSGKLLQAGNHLIGITATDTAGAKVSDQFYLRVEGNPTDVEEWSDDQISVYPNPSDQTIYISFGSSAGYTTYRIVDSLGKIIQQGSLETKMIDVSAINKGIYFLVLENKEWQIFRQIVIQ